MTCIAGIAHDGGVLMGSDSAGVAGWTHRTATEPKCFRKGDFYQVFESATGYDSCGTGEDAALGAMYATPKMSPRDRVKVALRAAEAFNAGVRGPFHIVSGGRS